MRRSQVLILTVGLVLLTLVLPVTAQSPLRIDPDRGVGVLSEEPADGEQWSTDVFPFGNYTGPESGEPVFTRTYLHFPLDAVPSEAAIESATLHVYADDFWPGGGSAPISVYTVSDGSWPEGDDWLDQANWPALGDTIATTSLEATEGWITWDVTAAVRQWTDGGANNGLSIAAADPASTESEWAGARRLTAGDPDTRPYLTVELATPTATPAPIATATASPPPVLPETGATFGGGWLLVGVLLILLGGVSVGALRRRGR